MWPWTNLGISKSQLYIFLNERVREGKREEKRNIDLEFRIIRLDTYIPSQKQTNTQKHSSTREFKCVCKWVCL